MPSYLKNAMRLAQGLGKLYPEGAAGFRAAPGAAEHVVLPGIGKVQARPIEPIQDVASQYMARRGMAPKREGFQPINPQFSSKVAEAYDAMRHDPRDPAVRRAYDALAEETMDQLRAAEPLGIKYEFATDHPSHRSPALGYSDIINKGRMAVYPTEAGFGSSAAAADNPLLKPIGKLGNNPNAVVNDAFRIVHDLYGHYGPGNPFFRAPGEERAFQLHSQMYSPEALPAATSETRGQNSWVNYGPHGEANRSASPENTIFAEQKSGIMPAWASELPPDEGADVEAYINSLKGKAKGGEVTQKTDVPTKTNFVDPATGAIGQTTTHDITEFKVAHKAKGGGAWTRKEGKNPEGGLNAKGRASLKAQGHDIKRPQPEGGSRRDSFCARMKGMKAKLTSKETANDPDSRINKSLRAWNCADGGSIRPQLGAGGDALKVAQRIIRAYHGSPHKFDKFDISKIGTGEGAQAYGHGLYFAGNEGVARGYRDKLSMGVANIGGRPISEIATEGRNLPYGQQPTIEHRIADIIDSYGDNAQPVMQARYPELLKAYNEMKSSGKIAAPGHMYEVNLHANPENLLDWDKPISSQPNIMKAYNQHIDELGGQDKLLQYKKELDAQQAERSKRFADAWDSDEPLPALDEAPYTSHMATAELVGNMNAGKNPKGEDFYRALSPTEYGYKGATENAQRLGMSGIKYLDQGSRGAGEGSQNYVMFSHEPVEILRRYNHGGSIRPQLGMGGDALNAAKLLANLAKQRPEAMKRARSMGFDTKNVFFHGTDQPIESFNPNVYLAKDPEIAEIYARKREYDPVQLDLFKPNPAPNIIPMFAKKADVETTNPIAGYHKVFDPRSLRSVFAEFNPDHADSADIMKSRGGNVGKAMRMIDRMRRDDGGRAHDFVQSQLFSGEPQVPQTNKPLEQATEKWGNRALGALKGAAYLYPPTRGAMGVYDAAHGLATGNPMEMASSVFALPGKAMKAIGAAGLSQSPEGEGAAPAAKLVRAAYGDGFARGGYATDGSVEGDVQLAPDDDQTPSFEDSGSMMSQYQEDKPQPTAHEFVQQQLGYGEPQAPQYDKEAEQAWKDIGMGAAHMGAYMTPLAPYVQAYDAYNAAKDIAANPRDPMAWGEGALTAALPTGGKAAKYLMGAGLAAGSMAPQEAQARSPYSEFLMKLATKYRSHYDPAARILGMPTRMDKGKEIARPWLSSNKLSRPMEDMSLMSQGHRPMVAERYMNPQDLAGKALITGMGDRTPAGYELTHLNDRQLRRPVNFMGGYGFGRDIASQGPDKSIWGSALTRAQAIANRGKEAADAGYEPVFTYVAQGPESGDFSHHMKDLVLGQLDPARISEADAAFLDKRMREAQTGSGEVFAPKPNWVGIKSPEMEQRFSDRADERVKLIKLMDAARFRDNPAFADIGASRYASVDPQLMYDPTFSAGKAFYSMNPKGEVVANPRHAHPSYNTQISAGSDGHGYLGRFEYEIPPEIHYHNYLNNEIKESLRGRPFSEQTMSLLKQSPNVIATPQWVDMASQYQDLMRSLYGKRRGSGGDVSKGARKSSDKKQGGKIAHAMHLASKLSSKG